MRAVLVASRPVRNLCQTAYECSYLLVQIELLGVDDDVFDAPPVVRVRDVDQAVGCLNDRWIRVLAWLILENEGRFPALCVVAHGDVQSLPPRSVWL